MAIKIQNSSQKSKWRQMVIKGYEPFKHCCGNPSVKNQNCAKNKFLLPNGQFQRISRKISVFCLSY
jgi:hypothetical protein